VTKSNKYRTSYSKTLSTSEEETIFSKFKYRLQQKGVNLSDCEPFQLQRYLQGDEYKIHYDAKDVFKKKTSNSLESPQRMSTAILYLNDEYSGGETDFPLKDIKIRPQVGALLIFRNCFDGSRALHPLSAHKSCIVTKGNKWIVSIWSSADMTSLF